MKDAMCILVLDDFYDDLKTKGTQIWNTAKQFVIDNKDTVHDVLSSIISKINPTASKIFDTAWTAFGGKILSQDPYAIDA